MSCSLCIEVRKDKEGFSIFECKSGFPITTGCWATGELEKNTISGVKCYDIEWCGSTYFESGGKPIKS